MLKRFSDFCSGISGRIIQFGILFMNVIMWKLWNMEKEIVTGYKLLECLYINVTWLMIY